MAGILGRYKNMIKLRIPCFIKHYFVGANGTETFDFCLKCLKWKYPELHPSDKEVA